MANTEQEAKFWLPNFSGLQHRLSGVNATLIAPRHFERNFRFDTSDGRLNQEGEVLRLRQTDRITLTYKRKGEIYEIRQEWEVEVDDFESTRSILEGLGFNVFHIYEKYREIFEYNDCLVMLDEVPYGTFVEIEGPELEKIQATALQIGLNWESRIQHTYSDMFASLSELMNPKPQDATFEIFSQFPTIDARRLDLPNGIIHPSDEVGSG